MRALILNGAEQGDVLTAEAESAMAEELAALGYEVETVVLRERSIGACRGCFGCWTRTPGECVIRDDAGEILPRYIAADLVVYVTPVSFGGYSARLKGMLDRVIPLLDPRFTRIHGEIHHRLRYDRYPRVVALGTLPAPDTEAEATFRTLLARNGLNFHAEAFGDVLAGAAGHQEARAAAATLLARVTREVAA